MSRWLFFSMCALLVLKPMRSAAQQETLRIRLLLNQAPLVPGKAYLFRGSDSVRITRFRFYLSQPEFIYHNGTKQSLPEFYQLVDADDTASLQIVLPAGSAGTLHKISFNLGVDSARSVSGVQTGALDPRHGMYWAWNSGYINQQLEGQSVLSPSPGGRFEYHLGGYARPNNALRRIALQAGKTHEVAGRPLVLCVDVGTWLSSMDMRTTHSVMIPGAAAMRLSDAAVNMFDLSVDEKK